MKKLLGTLAAATFVFGGCVASERPLNDFNDEDMQYNENTAGEYGELGNINADSGRMNGDIGQMQSIDTDATVRGYDDGEYTNVEVLAETNRGSAMHWLDIYGGLNHPALVPGYSASFVSGNYPASANQLHFEGMACQGNQAYAWDFDQHASQVDVTVEETADPNVVQVNYTTTVPDGSFIGGEQVSNGSFLLQQ